MLFRRHDSVAKQKAQPYVWGIGVATVVLEVALTSLPYFQRNKPNVRACSPMWILCQLSLPSCKEAAQPLPNKFKSVSLLRPPNFPFKLACFVRGKKSATESSLAIERFQQSRLPSHHALSTSNATKAMWKASRIAA